MSCNIKYYMDTIFFFFSKKQLCIDIKNTVHSIDFKPAGENVTSYSETPIEFVNEVARQMQWGYTTDI